MATIHKRKRLLDAYRFAGFRPLELVRGVFGGSSARVIPSRAALKKTVCKECGRAHSGWCDHTTRRVRDLSCGSMRVYLEFEVRRIFCRCCGKVKRERLIQRRAYGLRDEEYLRLKILTSMLQKL